jgi:hypothetical protein
MTKLSESNIGVQEFISLNSLSKKVGIARSTLKKVLIDKEITLIKKNSTSKISPFLISIHELKEKMSDFEFDDCNELKIQKLNKRIRVLENQIESLFKQVKVLNTLARTVLNENKEI